MQVTAEYLTYSVDTAFCISKLLEDITSFRNVKIGFEGRLWDLTFNMLFFYSVRNVFFRLYHT